MPQETTKGALGGDARFLHSKSCSIFLFFILPLDSHVQRSSNATIVKLYIAGSYHPLILPFPMKRRISMKRRIDLCKTWVISETREIHSHQVQFLRKDGGGLGMMHFGCIQISLWSVGGGTRGRKDKKLFYWHKSFIPSRKRVSLIDFLCLSMRYVNEKRRVDTR